VCRHAAPSSGVGNGGGAILNSNYLLAWIALGGSYSAGKAALGSAANSMRLEPASRNAQVVGMPVGYIDIDMQVAVDQPKISASEVIRLALNGMESGAFEIPADQTTHGIKAGLGAAMSALYPRLQHTS
jgi:NAD(P)-dependent dehydrogenase (short-subunit alcohol dehydrogenase family)